MRKTKKTTVQQAELPLPGTGRRPPTIQEQISFFEQVYMDPQKTKPKTRGARTFVLKAMATLPAYPTVADVGAWLKAQTSWGPGTMGQALKLGSLVCRRARNQWPLAVCPDPFADVPAPELPTEKPRAVPDEVLPALLAAMPDDRARALIAVQRYMGLRIGEALGLEWIHVDFAARKLTVIQQRDKGSSGPKGTKSKFSAAQMDLHPKVEHYLRRTKLQPVREGEARRLKRRSAAKVGRYVFPYFARDLDKLLERCRAVAPEAFPRKDQEQGRGGSAWHNFRHAFGASLERRGVHSDDAYVFLRHSDPSVTRHYYQRMRGRVVRTDELQRVWAEEAAEELGDRGASRSHLHQHASTKETQGRSRLHQHASGKETRKGTSARKGGR